MAGHQSQVTSAWDGARGCAVREFDLGTGELGMLWHVPHWAPAERGWVLYLQGLVLGIGPGGEGHPDIHSGSICS